MGPPAPGGHMGCRGCALAYMGQGHQPLEAHAPRYRKKGRVLKGEGTSEVPWGGWTPPPLGRTLPWRKGQGCALPLSLGPIYSGGGRAATHKPWRLPLPPVTPLPPRLRLAKPCWDPATSTTTPSCCWISINLSFPLAGSRRRRRLPSHTCVERGGAVRSALGHR